MKLYLLTLWLCLALTGGLLAEPGTPPPAPTDLAAQVTPLGSVPGVKAACVRLTWVPAPGVRFYKIYRDNLPLKTYWWPHYTDTQVQPGETHTYTVASRNGAHLESPPCAPVTVTLPGAGDQALYTDSLQSGWMSWSWAITDLASTAVVHSGADSIAVSAGPYGALYLHHDPQDAAPYAAVSFWINGGTTGGQMLALKATRSGAPQTTVPLPALAAGVWQQVTVPLADLGVAGAADLDGFWIQDATGTSPPTFYVDDVTLVAATVTAPAAPTGLSATPQWATSCPKCGGMAMAHIALAWTAVPGATSYNVYRNGAQTQTGLTSPAWTDMNVASGLSYTYTVTAVGPGGEGQPSAPASAVAPSPPGSALTAPVNLAVTGTWQAAPTDVLTWTAVPGAVSYNLYQYDLQIATGLTGTTYAVPPTSFFAGLTYAVTAVDASGAESLPSAIATAQGALAPGQTLGWGPPAVPKRLVATPEWNAGVPRIHLAWYGWDSDCTYNVYRDGTLVCSGLWGLNYYDTAVSPGETHSYTVSGVNVPVSAPVEGPQSVGVSATALLSAPAPAAGPVEITRVQPDDDSAVVSFAAVPGAADYRVYSLTHPNTVKYSGGSLSIEMNGLDPVNGADLVVEAMDKLGPFQKMDGMVGPGATQMDGMHEAINGQGDPSDVPNVLATSTPVHVTLQPRTLSGSQVFFDNFRGEQPLVLQPMPTPTGNPSDAYGQPQNYWEMANDKWRIRNYVGDVDNTKVFFMGSHFMDTLYDGGTARVNGPMHNNDASLVMMPRATADISGGGVLHVTFEVDAHFDSRRWCDLIVAPAAATLLNPGSKAGANRTFSGTDTAFRWRIEYANNAPEMVSQSADAAPQTVETFLVPTNGQAWDVAHSSARLDPYQGTLQANGTLHDLDKRHKFDLYLSQSHFRVYEQGVLAWEQDIPANLQMSAGPCQVYFVHQLYHTGNDRAEQVDWSPENTYWYNDRPWCDERHWDNCGEEVLQAFPPL